ncbi:MAG TPA: kelch repeat-containing protein [Chloroflexia bacterium]|nr:kelch repeat-containing protein [Chloroflexia bacterium]
MISFSRYKGYRLAAAWVPVLLGLPVIAAGSQGGHALAQGNTRTFPETGKSVQGLFLSYWDQHGGLPQQGFPISQEMQERSDLDGKTYTVQYFERAVFELHPENPAPYNVLLSQLGTFRYREKYPQGAPNQRPNNAPGSRLFEETGKRVGGRFLQYWQQNGGLPQQGFPISDEFTEVSDLDGKSYTVQYFERAVFEMHPENRPPFDVLLSQLGTFRYQAKYGAGAGATPTTAPASSSPTASPGASPANGTWTQAKPMPTFRLEHGTAVLGGKIYTVGGFAGRGRNMTEISREVEVYDPATDSWSSVAPIPEALHHAGVAASGTHLYVTGGYLTPGDPADFVRWVETNTTFAYDPAADRWTRMADMPKPRAAHTSAFINGKLYVIGGLEGDVSTELYAYDPATNTWNTSLPAMSLVREHLASTAIGGKLYVIGGRFSGNFTLLEAFDTATNTWERLASLPSGRSGFTAAALDGRIHIIGGETLAPASVLPGHDVYDPATNSWVQHTLPFTPRHGLSSVVFNGRWYVLGGATSAGVTGSFTSLTNSVDVFTPSR